MDAWSRGYSGSFWDFSHQFEMVAGDPGGGGEGPGGGGFGPGGGIFTWTSKETVWMIFYNERDIPYRMEEFHVSFENSVRIRGYSLNNSKGNSNEFNMGYANDATSLAGLSSGIASLSLYDGEKWLSLKKFKYYPKSWGGNGWTGARSLAIKNTLPLKKLGNLATYVNLGYSLHSVHQGIKNEQYSKAVFSGLSGIYSAISTWGGPAGMMICGPFVLIDATIGLDKYYQSAVDTEIERANKINRGDYSMWCYPKFGQGIR